jgi:UDP-N-acetylmuramyl pentapeptide phosphotransferase/UDP-N-acetylglucosamine-1-phosphate transferase
LLSLPVFHNFWLVFLILFIIFNTGFLEYSFKISEQRNAIVSIGLIAIVISILVALICAIQDAKKIEISEYGVKKFVTITQKIKKIDHAINYYYFSAKTIFEGDSLEFYFEVYNKQYKNFNIDDSIQIIFSKRRPSICRLK